MIRPLHLTPAPDAAAALLEESVRLEISDLGSDAAAATDSWLDLAPLLISCCELKEVDDTR